MAGPNDAQAAYWNEQAGPMWVGLQAALDAQLEGLSEAAIDALAPTDGEHVLDVGCGCGGSSLQLALRIEPEGAVTGVDISSPMLQVARDRAKAAGYEQIRFVEADAQTHPFAAGTFDAVFSRFGVMFFADPAAAFANLRRAVRPGGRLAFVCWQAPAANPWMMAPLEAALKRLPPQPPAPAPDPAAPGPFAFADGDRVRRILADAGWSQVALEDHRRKLGGRSLEESVDTAVRVGPLGALLRDHPEYRDTALEALREIFAAHRTPEGVRMDSATWIVTARNGA